MVKPQCFLRVRVLNKFQNGWFICASSGYESLKCVNLKGFIFNEISVSILFWVLLIFTYSACEVNLKEIYSRVRVSVYFRFEMGASLFLLIAM